MSSKRNADVLNITCYIFYLLPLPGANRKGNYTIQSKIKVRVNTTLNLNFVAVLSFNQDNRGREWNVNLTGNRSICKTLVTAGGEINSGSFSTDFSV